MASAGGAAVPTAVGSAPPPSQLAAVFGRLKEYGSNIFKQRKPWTEVLDRGAFSKPPNFGEAVTRIKKNSSYFRVNYLIVMVITCLVTFVMNPSSLFVLGLILGAWIYLLFVRQTPIIINGRTLTDREKMMGMSAISFITIFFLTSVGTVFFSALSISTAVVLLHGAVREPDNLFVDEAEGQSQSLLGIFAGSPAMASGINAV